MSALTVTVSAEDGAEVAQKTVRFQCGLFRETETFTGDDLAVLCRDTILDFACFMLAERFPDHPYGDLLEKVILFRHDSSSDSLALLQESDPIDDGMIIEIVLAATCKQEYDDTICPHILTVHTYRSTPMFCDYCGTILFGLMKQGLNCEGCDKNYHKKCAYKIPNNCTRLKDAAAEGICNMAQPRPKEVWSGRPLWIDKTLKGRRQVPHTLFVHSVKKPTQCHYCKKLLKGVFRQGLKCKDCNICVHKRCAKELGNNCAGEVPSLSRVDSGEWTMANIARHVIANEYSLAEEGGESHDGSSSQDDGRPPTHQQQAGGGGGGEEGAPPPDDSSPTSSSSSSSTSHECYHSTQPMSEPFIGAPMSAIAEEPSGEDTTSNEGSEHSPASRHDSTDNIRLQRVTGVSMRHTKPPPVSVMKEGWMVHYTNKSSQRKKHYWRLDTKCLTLYKTDSTSHYYKEVQLADILAVDPMVNPEMYPLTPPHVFEIVTSAMTYYVGVDMTGAQPGDLKPQTTVDVGAVNLLGDVSQLSLPQLEEKGVGMDAGIAWEEALHSALMPITPQASMGSLADIGVGGMVVRPASFRTKRGSLRGSLRGSFHGNRGSSFRGGSVRGRKGSTRGSFRVPKQGPGSQPPRSGATGGGGGGGGGGGVGAGSSAAVIKHPKVETKMDISLFYQIFPEEILGSGQFGTVFGGQNRQTGKTVAVKVIDKMRFPHKHESQLRTEVTILQTLEHPGIIFLEQMFESPEKIYVVMEKMNGDMLEMILSNENSRLTERTTKFMIYQILMALQYLHKKDIVHCDLKPENVLLTSECGMPMAKLCDFGFARIIGEKSFRKSIVGTPAYLAPEVLKNEGYNRSLDLWSVGVIVYVSLSGTFPFNEDEDIGDQITNAAFMYPPDPWTSISKEAVDLINRLLQVSRKSRFKATQALNHIWLRDVNLWEDLCQLEGTLGTRYMTHESEDTFWLKHGAKPHPLAKVEAQRRAQQQNAMNYTTTTASKASSSSSTSPSSSPPTTTKPSKGYENVTILTGHPLTNNSSTAAGSISSTDTTASSGPGASTAVTFNDVPYLNGSSRSGKDEQDRVTERQKEVTSDSEIKQANRNSDYLNMSDDEILAAQQHAERVGYKVSSV